MDRIQTLSASGRIGERGECDYERRVDRALKSVRGPPGPPHDAGVDLPP